MNEEEIKALMDRLNAARAAQYGTAAANATSAASLSIASINNGGGTAAGFADPSDPLVLIQRQRKPGTPTGTGSANAAEADIAPHRFVKASEAVNQIFASDSYRAQVAKQMVAAGILDPTQENDLFAITDAWSKVVDQAAMFQTAGAGKTPLEVLKLIRMEQKAKAPTTVTADTTTTQNYSATDAQGQTTKVLQQMLGRNPTTEEMATYRAGLNAAAAADPQKAHSVTHTDANGNTVTDQNISGGIDPTTVLGNMAQTDPEYGAYQASTTYMDALKQAIQAFV